MPFISYPKPGEGSEGLRIINTAYLKGEYGATVEGLRSKQYDLKVWASDPGKYKVEGANIKDISGNIIPLTPDLPNLDENYAVKKVILSSGF